MIQVYKEIPVFTTEGFYIRECKKEDTEDLLKVYSDEKAVPFFNSDNCHGDTFYYKTKERMEQAVSFWIDSYIHGYFVRWSILAKETGKAIGTIECFHRDAEDAFTNCALLRLDLKSEYEKQEVIEEILKAMIPDTYEMFVCERIATKAIPEAAERGKALTALGFKKSLDPFIGQDGTVYGDYYVL